MGKKIKEFLNDKEIKQAQKKAFIEYNYGDSHKITPIIQKSIKECVGECNKQLGHEIELLDFIRCISYATHSLLLHETSSDIKDLTREQMQFITKYSSDSVDAYIKEYMKKFDNISSPIIMQFPFLALDASAYRIISVVKALEMESKKNN